MLFEESSRTKKRVVWHGLSSIEQYGCKKEHSEINKEMANARDVRKMNIIYIFFPIPKNSAIHTKMGTLSKVNLKQSGPTKKVLIGDSIGCFNGLWTSV